MRRHILTSTIAGIAFLIGLFTILLMGQRQNANAQVVMKAVAGVQVQPGGAEKQAKAASVEFISFPADRDAQQLLEAVQQYIQEAKADNEKWDRICEAAQRVLDIKSDSFFETEEVTDGEKKKSRISVKVKANRLIGSFKPAGRQFYQLTYGPQAKQLLNEAIAANYDRVKLADISQRYFHTTAGAEATLLLGGLNLDRGQYLEAAYAYDQYLSRPDIKESITPRTLFKAAIAFKRSGDPANLKRAQTLWDDFAKAVPRDGLAIGNRNFSETDLKAEFDRPVQSAYAKANDGLVTMRLANASHTALEEGGTVFLDPTFSIPMVYSKQNQNSTGYDWVRQNLEISLKSLSKQKSTAIIPGFFPVTAPGVLIYRNYSGVFCIATSNVVGGKPREPGEIIWYSTPNQTLVAQANSSQVDSLNASWTYYQNAVPSLLFENPLTGSLSHDGKHVYYVDDLAVPPPPTVGNQGMGMGGMGGIVQGGASSSGQNSPTLAAVNIETGKVLWELGGPGGGNTTDEQDDAQTNPTILMQGAYFLGPPLPVNGKLYVLFEKNGKLRLACLDNEHLVTVNDSSSKVMRVFPSIVWSQRLGEPKERLPNDSIRRFQCSYLAYADGVLVCGTNTGAVVGIDVMSRSLLWAHSYRTRDNQADPNENPNGPGGFGRRIRPAFINGMPANGGPVSQSRWRASAPIIANGRVIVTAYDSKVINCIDLRSGNLIWNADMDGNDDLYVGNVMNGKVLVVGTKKCRAYDLDYNPVDPKVKKAEPVWSKLAIGLPCGHGVASKDGLYYLPIAKTADSDQPQIWGIDPVKGEVVSKSTFRRKLSASVEDAVPLGNLVFQEGQVFAVTPKEILAFPLIEMKRKQMDDLLRANPNDPTGLASRGELKLDEGKVADAIKDLKAALAGKPSDSVRSRVRDKLYLAYTELLRSDFSSGKQFLDEYKGLLEISIDTEEPTERKKLIDEQLRRQSTFLSLWAKGKEKEGDLVEAFHYYREFAKLGDNKTTIPIDGEPFGLIRPDIWARGRIEGMIRNATSPNQRKPLESLVEAEWNSVKSDTDPSKLREFVRIFGPYFAAGKEAQLSLAEKLLATNNEENAKEAEGYLSQLMAADGSDPLSGRAAELLARNLMQHQMYEDAVALYSQIGTRFETTVIREGKTGADFLAAILTDRRLLPYLEPARIRSQTRAKVEIKNEMRNGNFESSFQVEPEGELMPFFRRFRLTIEVKNGNGQQSWTLSVKDKASGALRCKFDNLIMPMMVNSQPNFSWSDVKVAQANGHLLLLHCGTMVYCIDLADKKLVWQYNLIAGQGALNVRSQTTSTDGEMSIMFEDGWLIRMSRSSLLRDGFAALLTRDGLVAIDSFTGQKLWQLSAVNPRSILFGDNRYLLVADPGDGKPTSKVIRAADGTTVEGVADFSKLVVSQARLKLIGRNILLYDKQKDKTIRLYDPIEAKDVWSRPVEEKTQIVNCFDSQDVALLSPSGKLEVLEPASGKVLFSAKLDAEKYKEAIAKLTTPTILTDGDRYYLVLNNSRRSAMQSMNYYNQTVRSMALSGPMICFDRASGEQLWATDKLLEGQHLVTDRFADLPVLLATVSGYDQTTSRQISEVVALDKVTGKIKMRNTNLPANGQFMELKQNKGVFELLRYDTKVVITPLEAGKE